KGRGRMVLRARAVVEEKESTGKQQIVVTEIPYQVNKANLIAQIAQLANDKKLEGIADIQDYSDREGMRIVIDLKRDAVPAVVLNQLYKHSQMQTTFGAIMLAVVDGEPQEMTLKEELSELAHGFGDERRTEIVADQGEFSIEDLIAEEDMVITVSHAGYIKRLPVSAYRRQRRGGKGVISAHTKEDDWVEHLFIAS